MVMSLLYTTVTTTSGEHMIVLIGRTFLSFALVSWLLWQCNIDVDAMVHYR